MYYANRSLHQKTYVPIDILDMFSEYLTVLHNFRLAVACSRGTCLLEIPTADPRVYQGDYELNYNYQIRFCCPRS